MFGMTSQDGKFELGQADDVMLPGFRFHPTDEELVSFYLRRKIQRKPLAIDLIIQLDIYKFDPWELPKMATIGEREWYFFCPRDRKYRNSTRPNRVTCAGFWKATGTDRPIYSTDGTECVGLKKSLVFYKGRAAKGLKTDWMMHEFRLPYSSEAARCWNEAASSDQLQPQDAWAICRIFKKATSHRSVAAARMWASTNAAAAAPDAAAPEAENPNEQSPDVSEDLHPMADQGHWHARGEGAAAAAASTEIAFGEGDAIARKVQLPNSPSGRVSSSTIYNGSFVESKWLHLPGSHGLWEELLLPQSHNIKGGGIVGPLPPQPLFKDFHNSLKLMAFDTPYL